METLKQISEVEPVYTTKRISEFHELYTTVVRIKINGVLHNHRGPCRFTVLASEKACADSCIARIRESFRDSAEDCVKKLLS